MFLNYYGDGKASVLCLLLSPILAPIRNENNFASSKEKLSNERLMGILSWYVIASAQSRMERATTLFAATPNSFAVKVAEAEIVLDDYKDVLNRPWKENFPFFYVRVL